MQRKMMSLQVAPLGIWLLLLNQLAQAQAPPEWTCPSKHYANNDGCDCGCGAFDFDCVFQQFGVFCFGRFEQDARCDFETNACVSFNAPPFTYPPGLTRFPTVPTPPTIPSPRPTFSPTPLSENPKADVFSQYDTNAVIFGGFGAILFVALIVWRLIRVPVCGIREYPLKAEAFRLVEERQLLGVEDGEEDESFTMSRSQAIRTAIPVETTENTTTTNEQITSQEPTTSNGWGNQRVATGGATAPRRPKPGVVVIGNGPFNSNTGRRPPPSGGQGWN